MADTLPSSVAEETLAQVWFLDVGQGDCTLAVDSRSKRGILLDCPSGQNAVVQVLDLLAGERLKLSAVVVSHWDLDHYGGIARVATEARPEHVFYNHDTLFEDGVRGRLIRSTLKHFLDLHLAGSELHSIRAGDRFAVGSLEVTFLAPTPEELTRAYVASTRNVASCVVSIDLGGSKVIIGGDAVGPTWQRLIDQRADIKADILRWPHHGAALHGDDPAGSLAAEVIALVAPRHLIVSTGSSNRYGHPMESVVRTSAMAGNHVMCTQVTPGCFGHLARTDRIGALDAGWVAQRGSSVKCAGSIVIRKDSNGLSVVPSLPEHGDIVDTWPAPMCRR